MVYKYKGQDYSYTPQVSHPRIKIFSLHGLTKHAKVSTPSGNYKPIPSYELNEMFYFECRG